MAFIFPRDGYYVLIDKKKKLWKKLGKISYRDAKIVLRDYENKKTRLDIKLPVTPVDITFQKLKEEYLEDINGIKAKTTYKKEKDCLSLLSKNLGDIKISDIDTSGLEGLLKNQNCAPSTFHDRAKVLRNVFKFSVEKDYLPDNPATNIRLPDLPELPPRSVDPDILQQVFKQMKGKTLAYYKALYYTGMRPSEVIRLRKSDIDLKNRRIYVIKTKTGKFRIVPIHKLLIPYIKELMANTEDYLFPGDEDGHQRSMKSAIDRVIRKLKLKGKGVFRYAFRHTFATEILSNTSDLRAVQTLLGHSKITMTQRYAHVLNKNLVKAVDTL